MHGNISKTVRKILAGYPYIKKYLSMGVINNRALAKTILKEVKRELNREVNIQSVVTAIRRLPTKKEESSKILEILAKSEVNLKYDIGVLTLKKSSKLPNLGEDYIVIQGLETTTIVGEEKKLAEIEKILEDSIIEKRKNLASIIVKSPKEIASTYGVIAHMANALTLEKINIVEMMSSYIETCFIVEEKDALKTIEIIRNEIKRARSGS